jgi:hypothetical protein
MSAVKGWVCWQQPLGFYEIGIDDETTCNDKASGFVRHEKEDGKFGALMQKVDAEAYRSKRLRFSGQLKCQGLDHFCGFFMEVFHANGQLLSVDNMYSRKITVDQDWKPYDLVLDIDDSAYGINIGVRLVGRGQVWISDLAFEEVSADIPVTDELPLVRYASEPQNLEFAR